MSDFYNIDELKNIISEVEIPWVDNDDNATEIDHNQYNQSIAVAIVKNIDRWIEKRDGCGL